MEGIAAHWVAEQLHAGKSVEVGDEAPNHVVVNGEMLTAAKYYVSLLHPKAHLEDKVDLSKLHEGMYGYVDAIIFSFETRIWDIYDFKYGHGKVDEYENWQMLLGMYGKVADRDTIRMHVVQPRCYQAESHRVWEITGKEYNTVYVPRIKDAVANVISDNPRTQSGPQCTRCPANGSCLTLALAGYDAIDRAGEAVSGELTPEQLANELNALTTAQERIKARLIGLEESASSVIRKGGRVPGYTLTPQKGHLKWTASQKTVIAMAKMNGVDVCKPTEVITPTQAIAASMSETLVNSISTRPPKAPKLTKVKPNQAKKVFKS